MVRIAVISAVAALSAYAGPLMAQPKPVEIAPDKDWEHTWTPMTFPARLGEFERSEVFQFQERESDISANYLDAAGSVLSLYIYRPGVSDASIWHDRALVSLGANDVMFGTEGVQGKRSASFKPAGHDIESGILTVLTSNGDFRSTGVALYSHGNWLVKVRLSSRGLDPDGLEALLRELLTQLPDLDNYAAHPAYLIEACLDPMTYSNADRLRDDRTEAGLDSLMDVMVDLKELREATGLDDAPYAQYCREGDGGAEGSIYRPIGMQDRYLIAFGDSGTSASVNPAKTLEEVLKEEDGVSNADKAHFAVSHSTGTHIRYFMPFHSLPQPNQAVQVVFGEQPILTADRPLGEEALEVTLIPHEEPTSKE